MKEDSEFLKVMGLMRQECEREMEHTREVELACIQAERKEQMLRRVQEKADLDARMALELEFAQQRRKQMLMLI